MSKLIYIYVTIRFEFGEDLSDRLKTRPDDIISIATLIISKSTWITPNSLNWSHKRTTRHLNMLPSVAFECDYLTTI